MAPCHIPRPLLPHLPLLSHAHMPMPMPLSLTLRDFSYTFKSRIGPSWPASAGCRLSRPSSKELWHFRVDGVLCANPTPFPTSDTKRVGLDPDSPTRPPTRAASPQRDMRSPPPVAQAFG
ncbi:hypothetical protein VDGL01_02145 [Verticillium dahliae]